MEKRKLLTADEVVEQIFRLFHERGDDCYGEEITQREHALQTAALARQAGDPPQLVVACLLHDIGHLLPIPAPFSTFGAELSETGVSETGVSETGVSETGASRGYPLETELVSGSMGEMEDLLHEELGARWLEAYFPAAITEPIRLHVAAKRYLCWRDPAYHAGLSAASRQSLLLQGGPMDESQAREFEHHPHGEYALRLRQYDDRGKVPGLPIPELVTYLEEVRQSIRMRRES